MATTLSHTSHKHSLPTNQPSHASPNHHPHHPHVSVWKPNSSQLATRRSTCVTVGRPVVRLVVRRSTMFCTTSQLLNLDEIETVRLIHTAYATTAGSTSEAAVQPLAERIMRVYYARRYNLYVSVLDLVLMYENPSFPVELLLPINQYVSALLASSGLLSHVLSLIAALTTQLLSSSSSSSSSSAATSLALATATATSSTLTAIALLPHRIQELSHLCSLLLAISRKHPPTAAEGTQLIATLQSLSTLTTQHQQQQQATTDNTATLPLTPELDTARRVCYSLLTALLSSLSVKLAAVTSAVHSENDVSRFVSALQAEGDKPWTSVDFNAAWFLCWSLFLRRLKPILPSLAVDDTVVTNMLLMALSTDVGLIGVVHREWLSAATSTAVGRISTAPVGWERREDVSEVWTELYASLLLHASDEVELMRDEDAKSADDSNFYYLLLSLSTLCQQSERNVSLLWSLDQTTNLIQSCLEQPTSALLSSPLLFALVSLLSSLTLDSTADYGLRVWELLNESSSLSWHNLFGILDQVARVYLPTPPTSLQQPAPQPANVITAGESALLCALLSVLTAALSSIEVQSLLLGSQGAQYKPLDRLFALLGCRLDTVLKSAVLDAINALCSGERQVCVDVWERMERAGMLAREDGLPGAAAVVAAGGNRSGGGVGVWYDVEEVESVQRRYMLTIAFSRLVLTLLSSTPLPSPSLSHYLSFLTQHLFLSLSDRQYERPIERWKLTEACLAIAALCIESATPTPVRPRDGHEADVGLSLVRDLLQGKELLVKLLETLSRAYQLLEAAASTTVAPLPSTTAETGEHVSVLERGETEVVRYVEGSMVAVLRVLWDVMGCESEWMELLKTESGVKAAGGRLYSLSSLLFGHGQEALVIAHASAYVEGGGSVVGRVMAERERRRRREREEELEAWKGAAEEREEKEKRMADEGVAEDRDAEDDEGGYIPYYCTLLLHHLATASPSRLSNLLLASHLAPDVSRSLASLLTSTQLPSHASQPAEASRTHQARIEAVRVLREGVVEGGLGLVLLGFDLGVNGEGGHGRLELSDRRFALDAIIELVQKPRSPKQQHTHDTSVWQEGECVCVVSSMTILNTEQKLSLVPDYTLSH